LRHQPDNTSAATPGDRSPLTFFALVFALSIPFWLIGALTRLQLSPNLPISSFIWVCPAIAASSLVYHRQGAGGVSALLRRSFDVTGIQATVWVFPAVLLLPSIQAITHGAMRLLSLP
jgi:hypothetical protein